MGKIFKKVNVKNLSSSDLKKLKIKCGSTKCDEGLHCYSRWMERAERKYHKKSVCYECGDSSIDWERMYKKDIKDSKHTFNALNKELIRYVFWKMKIDKLAIEKALKMNKRELRDESKKKLKQRIGKLTDWDGQQTPLGKDNIINYAQHATATCCRQCLAAWHNIAMEHELSEVELDFCTNLVMKFIEERIQNIAE